MSKSKEARARKRVEEANERQRLETERRRQIWDGVRGGLNIDICSSTWPDFCGRPATRWFDVPHNGARAFCSGHLPSIGSQKFSDSGTKVEVLKCLTYDEATVWAIMQK